MAFGRSRDFILLLALCTGKTQSGRQVIAVPWCETIVAMETTWYHVSIVKGGSTLCCWICDVGMNEWMKNASEFLSVVRCLFQLPLTEIRRGFSKLCHVQTSGTNSTCVVDSSAEIQDIYSFHACFLSSFTHWKEIDTKWKRILKLYVYYMYINWITDGRIILTHCGRVTQICVFNTVKLGTSASSP